MGMSFSKVVGEEDLRKTLRKMDGRRYGAYKKLKRVVLNYDFGEAMLTRIQGDPYAPPSVIEVTVPPTSHRIPSRFFDEKCLTPLLDYLARIAYRRSLRLKERCGTGNSGYIGVPRPSPRIIRRSSVDSSGRNLIFRIFIGLPARGRRILGMKAEELLLWKIPELIRSTLSQPSLDDLEAHVNTYLDQEYVRGWLYENDYVAFIGDGSILPRESSYSVKPLKNAVPMKAPSGLRARIRLPSGRTIEGMAIPRGFIVITGGGYHGKTTLLEAIQEGVYDHVRGDGRELAVSRSKTVLVKAEDGRLIFHVDVSSFIGDLPGGGRTEDFSSYGASGSTSMAASISEAIEAGAEVLLIDEDTSATNMLYKDDVMTRIIRREPIKPLCMQGKSMVERCGIGVIAVAGASSSLISIADRVILMESYLPKDVTTSARSMAPPPPKLEEYEPPKRRVFYGVKGLRKIKVMGFKLVASYDDGGRFELDLSDNPRIVEKAQAKMIAHVIMSLRKPADPIFVDELAEHVNESFRDKGFEAFVKPVPPDLASVDGLDVVWALNRLRNSSFSQ